MGKIEDERRKERGGERKGKREQGGERVPESEMASHSGDGKS